LVKYLGSLRAKPSCKNTGLCDNYVDNHRGQKILISVEGMLEEVDLLAIDFEEPLAA
jgi:hypothetical protein